MIRKLLLLASLIFFVLPITITAQMTYVPDDNFEQALIDLGLDTPPLNDSVPTKNIDTVTYLNVGLKGISDLTGIEGFLNLINLSCFQNQLTSLDVSKNQSLRILICSFNRLISIDISNNSELLILNCDSNLLTSLDVSKNQALEELYCYYNKLASIDLYNNPNLKRFECWHNKLENLDVSKNLALILLSCDDNKLTSLDVSKNLALIELNCFYNHLISLDVSKNLALIELNCFYNQLTSLDVNQNFAMEKLNCDKNQITNLDFKNNPILKSVSCSNNMLTSLDFRNNPDLITIDCEGNLLTSLDVSKNLKLKNLQCYSNELTNLDVSNNPVLYFLYATLNPNLKCIQVIDSLQATKNTSWYIDSTAHYSTDCGITGILDNKINYDSISLAPNPASDYIEITLDHHTLKGVVEDIRIYDLLGVEFQKGMDSRFRGNDSHFLEGSSVRIDVSHLAPGVYFVRVGDVVRKFVKF